MGINMRMSDQGRAMLTRREGVRLKAYLDSVGVWTIGIGHTSMAGPPTVTKDLTITRDECDAIFRRDLAQYENAVNKAVNRPLAQNQFDACVSLCYNIGTGGFARSSAVRAINAGDMDGAAKAFMMWVKPPEITGRRKTEVTQFKTPYSGATNVPITKNTPTSSVEAKDVVKSGAPADGVSKPKNNNASFWAMLATGVGGGLTAAYNFLLASLPWIVAIVGLIVLFIYVLRPAYLRWRDHLQYAPEFIDADRKTKFKALFSGFRTKMLARLTEASGVLVVALNAAGSVSGSGIFDINALLPTIPLSFGNEKSISLEPSQYLFAGTILIGRANEWLRNRSTTIVGTIDPALAVSMAANSPSIDGSAPSSALAEVTDRAGLVDMIEAPLVRIRKRVKAKKTKRKAKRV